MTNIILGVSSGGSVALASHTASNKQTNKPKNVQHLTLFPKSFCLSNANTNSGMGHEVFALDNQINNVYGNLKDQMKLDLCIYEVLKYTHITMETAFVGMAKINTNIIYANI